MTTFRAGAASLPLEPPLDLPMVGFIRQRSRRAGLRHPSRDERRRLRARRHPRRALRRRHRRHRLAAGRGADRARRRGDRRGAGGRPPQLEPHASRADGRELDGEIFGDMSDELRASVDAFARVIQDKVVSVCRLAAERLEPARVVWGQEDVDLAVNRRERRRGRLDPRLEPRRAGRQPGHRAPGAASRRIGDRDRRRLRLSSGDDRPRHVPLLGRLPRADAPRRPERDGRRVRLLPGRRRQRPAEVLVHEDRGRGGADGHAAGGRRRLGGRRPLRDARGDRHRAGRLRERLLGLPRTGARRARARACCGDGDRDGAADAASVARRGRARFARSTRPTSRTRARAATTARSRSPTTTPPGRGRSSRSSATGPRRLPCAGTSTRCGSATA